MMSDHSQIREEALDWLIQTNDPAFDRWDDFTLWLEADTANGDAFHSVAQCEAELGPIILHAQRDADPVPKRSPARQWAAAASLALAAMIGSVVLLPRLTPETHETRPGQVTEVSLGGQDRIVLNGGTRVTLSGWTGRTIQLSHGQILVQLRDPSGEGIEVVSGDLKLVDVGTVFEVVRDNARTRVLVSEGTVIADPGGAKLRIDAGERLDTSDGASVLETRPADAASIGAFAAGQLTYVNEPLENVVADLRRSAALNVTIDRDLRTRAVTGTLSVSAVKRDPRSLGGLLGVGIEQSSAGWRLTGRAGQSER